MNNQLLLFQSSVKVDAVIQFTVNYFSSRPSVRSNHSIHGCSLWELLSNLIKKNPGTKSVRQYSTNVTFRGNNCPGWKYSWKLEIKWIIQICVMVSIFLKVAHSQKREDMSYIQWLIFQQKGSWIQVISKAARTGNLAIQDCYNSKLK